MLTASFRRRALFPAAEEAATTTTCGRCSIMNFNKRSISACCLATAAPDPVLPAALTAMFGHCRKSTSSPSASSMANVVGGSPGPHTAAKTLTSMFWSSYSSTWSSRISGLQGATEIRLHSASPHSRRTATSASLSRHTAASRVRDFTRCRRMPRSRASRRSAFHASAIGVDASSKYAASASAMSSST